MTDVSQISQVATVLPGILVQAAYSRGFEQQADDDAAAALKRLVGTRRTWPICWNASTKVCARNPPAPPSRLGTHTETGQQALRLRNSAAGKAP
jgi:hypothetical protein